MKLMKRASMSKLLFVLSPGTVAPLKLGLPSANSTHPLLKIRIVV